ncbi:hypothetical protein KIN20_000149 [Parelaphostrongylus tenuis]|uniref:Uncharacterized protein n=1 Tax=Parelaphostrongylus tenuis TaxID=148309 RepID=A0AAD5QBM9_PARTN|nr:hypothetical protein KIN20_000149 [Parelaphostrongylus tenuis]
MAWTSDPAVAAKNTEILRSEMEVQSLVQNPVMHAVTDVLEEQGRRAGLLPTVISAILDQLTIQARYSPLQCQQISDGPAGPKGTCFISDNTVIGICDMPPQGGNDMCELMQSSTVPIQHRTISGKVSTTNIIMANWSTQMWQDVMNRVARSLASGPFRMQFFGVSVTVRS